MFDRLPPKLAGSLVTLAALTLLLAPACSGDEQAADRNNGWMVGDNNPPDDARDMSAHTDMPEDAVDLGDEEPVDASITSPEQDQGELTDQGPTGGPDFPDPVVDMIPPAPDMPTSPEPDMFTPPAPDMGGGAEGDGCATTGECGSGLVCCAGLSGQLTCTPEDSCFTGGVCEMDNECPGAQQCCEFMGAPRKVCADSCMIDMGCQSNTECASTEVCCPGFGGAPSCTPTAQCSTGGRCQMSSDCRNNQECCMFGGFGLCADSCMPQNMGCQSNTECASGEVCCPGLSGAPSCAPAAQCSTGGRCQMDMDCLNNQECCGFGDFRVCLDQCGF